MKAIEHDQDEMLGRIFNTSPYFTSLHDVATRQNPQGKTGLISTHNVSFWEWNLKNYPLIILVFEREIWKIIPELSWLHILICNYGDTD